MMKVALSFVLYLTVSFAAEISAGKPPPPTTTTTTSSSTSTDDVDDVVKGYIDAGTCDTVTTGSTCGDDATSYYSEFEYNGYRVVIANGIPDHDAEEDALVSNPNTRCER